MATVTHGWLSGGITASVTFNNATGAVSSVSVTNNTGAPATANVAVSGKGAVTHTFPIGTSTWSAPAGMVWEVDTPTFSVWWS